jgi:hypothetical protein
MMMFQPNRKTLAYIEAVGVAAALAVVLGLVLHAWIVGQSDPPSMSVGSLDGRQVFPADDPWNSDVSTEPLDPNSDAIIASIGADEPLHTDFGRTFGIPYVIVSADQAKVAVTFANAAEADAGPYPIPPDALVEASGDRHVLVLDKSHWMLYELYAAFPQNGGWRADCGAIFDLSKISVQRHPGYCSADAAGLPIFPGLVRYDEVAQQRKIAHALRFTVKHTRRGYVYPAMCFASRDTNVNLPPMGMRVRLKNDFDVSQYPSSCRVILQGLKTYGMILADNGGDWYISGSPDPRWNDDELNMLRNVKGSNFEVVRMGEVVTKLVKVP